MSLQAKLDAFKADFEAGKPPYNATPLMIRLVRRALDELIASGASARALKAGDLHPPFILNGPNIERVSSVDFLREGPLVVSFYQGLWCPYCNIELQALQAALPAFKAAGATLVAISPQTPSNSRQSQRVNELSFPILSDEFNLVAASFGLRIELPEYLIEVHKNLKNDLPKFNGDDSWTLPMPARFVIDQSGFIRYAEVNPDYTRRPDPRELLPVLRSLTRGAASAAPLRTRMTCAGKS